MRFIYRFEIQNQKVCTRIMSGHACAMYSFYCNLIKFYGNLIVLAFLSIITTFIKKIKAQILGHLVKNG